MSVKIGNFIVQDGYSDSNVPSKHIQISKILVVRVYQDCVCSITESTLSKVPQTSIIHNLTRRCSTYVATLRKVPVNISFGS